MARWFWIGCLILGLTTIARAEEYILNLDEVGYKDQPIANDAPKETNFRHIEVLVEPGKPFYLKTKSGKETIVFSGEFLPPESDDAQVDFHIELRYRHLVDTGLVKTQNNRLKPVFDEHAFHTQLGINITKPLTANELRSRGEKLKSRIRRVLTLTKYNPTIKE